DLADASHRTLSRAGGDSPAVAAVFPQTAPQVATDRMHLIVEAIGRGLAGERAVSAHSLEYSAAVAIACADSADSLGDATARAGGNAGRRTDGLPHRQLRLDERDRRARWHHPARTR